MLDSVEKGLDQNRWRIDGTVANLRFIIEYLESNGGESPHIKHGGLQDALMSISRELEQVKDSIEEARDKHILIRGDISELSQKGVAENDIVSSDKLVDLYLNAVDSSQGLDEFSKNKTATVAEMRRNRLARQKKAAEVSDTNSAQIDS